MSQTEESLEDLLNNTEQYGRSAIEIAKLKVLQSTITVASYGIARISNLFIFLIAISLVSVGLSVWIGTMMGELYYGFFIVAGLYALLGIIQYFFLGKWIHRVIGETLIKNVLHE
jgi:hypothetical protein